MKIAIELLVILAVIFILLAWALWYRITTWWANKKYNEDNDRSKKGEERRRARLTREATENVGSRGTGKLESEITDANVPRPSQPEGRELLPPTNFDSPLESERDTGKEQSVPTDTGISIGKVKLGFRNPFRRN